MGWCPASHLPAPPRQRPLPPLHLRHCYPRTPLATLIIKIWLTLTALLRPMAPLCRLARRRRLTTTTSARPRLLLLLPRLRSNWVQGPFEISPQCCARSGLPHRRLSRLLLQLLLSPSPMPVTTPPMEAAWPRYK